MSAQYKRCIYKEASKLSSSIIQDKAEGIALQICGLDNYTPTIPLVGKVYPVRTNGNILPILQSLEHIENNSILVIEDTEQKKALLGDIVMLALKKQGVKGIVCDGYVRDIEHAADIGIAVWSRGVTPRAAGLGKAGFPVDSVSIVNNRVSIGDWMFGDRDGLVVIPEEQARYVVKSASIKNKREQIYKKRIENGESLYEMMNIAGHVYRNEDVVVEF